MAAAAEVHVQESAPKKARGLEQLEHLVKTRFDKVQASVKGVETELRSRAAHLRKSFDEFQTTALTRLGTLRETLSLESVKTKLGMPALQVVGQTAERLFKDGVRRSEVAVDKLGLAKVIELPGVAQLAATPAARQAFEKVHARFEEMRARFEGVSPEKAPTGGVPSAPEKNVE